MNDHSHRWEGMADGKRLACHGCHTVTTIKDLLANTAAAAAHNAKIQLLSKQLYAKDLKKEAHDAAYAWVRQNVTEGTLLEPPGPRQGQLL